jgi:transcription elongation GreA/GreB family factor
LSTLKHHLYNYCLLYIEQRVSTIQKAIKDAQASANEETKSSAGDKYETGRSMMQLEIEKNTTQLAQALKLKQALSLINPDKKSSDVQNGSIVITDQSNYYIAISINQIDIEGTTYFPISPASPIGLKMMGLKKQDSFQWNKTTYTIREII